jgi:hypothetical protein
VESSWCLDSNFDGDVYINPCQLGNRYQQWERWEGGWTRNVATGRCLSGGTWFAASNIYTSTCNASFQFQWWVHWELGWYQRPAYHGYLSRCLARLPESLHDVIGLYCVDPRYAPNSQRWFTRQV